MGAKTEETLIHDFADKDLGKVVPYGIYDVGRSQGWVSVGIDHGTAQMEQVEQRMFLSSLRTGEEDLWLAKLSYQTIIDSGLKIKARLIRRRYPTGIEIPDSEMAKLHLKPAAFHPDWNYSLLPQ